MKRRTNELAYRDFLVQLALWAALVLPTGLGLADPHELGKEEKDGKNESGDDPAESSANLGVGVDSNDGEEDGESGGPDDGIKRARHEIVCCDTIRF